MKSFKNSIFLIFFIAVSFSGCKEIGRNIYTAQKGKYFKFGEREERYKSIEFTDGKATILTDFKGERTIYYGFDKFYITEENM
jgi:hypothetical protein